MPQESGLGARLTLTSFFNPLTPFCGMVNSFLHVGHIAFDPGRLPLQWSWRQPRQNVWKQGIALGLLGSLEQMEHVVVLVTAAYTHKGFTLFLRPYKWNNVIIKCVEPSEHLNIKYGVNGPRTEFGDWQHCYIWHWLSRSWESAMI